MTRLDVHVVRTVGQFTLDVRFASSAGITALVGASGSGKTLTLRAIAGLLRPVYGHVRIGDVTLFDVARAVDLPARARNIGYVFQQYALFPHLTVAENVAYGLRSRGDAARARVRECLALVGLEGRERDRPRVLSGGQQQRVALARALAPSPSLLLLDEPFAALDAPLRRRLGDELRALHERTGVPMVLVTHDPEEAERLAGAVVRVEGGRAGG